MTLLEISQLKKSYAAPDGGTHVVVDVPDFKLEAQAQVALSGESGSGKSQTFMTVMGLLARNGRAEGRVLFRGEDILGAPPKRLNRIRGSKMTMIFQDPLTALTPHMRVGEQIAEPLTAHLGLTREEAEIRALDWLERVRIPDARRRLRQYPHELSGGMRQRVMIALALSRSPQILIADEPTTALDVTVQAQILDLLLDLRESLGMAIILITHDLGVVAETCERAIVMYAGRKVEEGPVEAIFARPLHPYTRGLLRSAPRLGRGTERGARLPEIPGMVPSPRAMPHGCRFAPRCDLAQAQCEQAYPDWRERGAASASPHAAACWRADEEAHVL